MGNKIEVLIGRGGSERAQLRAHPATHFQLPGEGARPFNFGAGRNKDFYLLSQPARDDRIWGGLGGARGWGGEGREGKGEAVLLNASFGKGKQRVLGLPGSTRGARHPRGSGTSSSRHK